MPTYQPTLEFEHGAPESTGILLANLGTPDAPTTAAVRRFLKEFLSDPRVVEYPRLLWWLILNGVILRVRPSRSAAAYREIWTDDGSPLLLHSRSLAAGIRERLEQRAPGEYSVELGMTYGKPSIASAIDKLRLAGARRLLVLPFYPQYSGTTTASVFDAVTRKLQKIRWVPETRFVNQYHDEPGYIVATTCCFRFMAFRDTRWTKATPITAIAKRPDGSLPKNSDSQKINGPYRSSLASDAKSGCARTPMRPL